MAGRGFGKARAGAERVREIAHANPDARIALVAASLVEARSVMVEGECGIVEISPPTADAQVRTSAAADRLAQRRAATLYSAPETEALWAPQPAMPAGQAQKEFFVNEALLRADAAI